MRESSGITLSMKSVKIPDYFVDVFTAGFCQSVTSVITDVTATIIFGNGIQYGSVASLSCSAYREIHGAATVQCANGSWDFVKGVPTICHCK